MNARREFDPSLQDAAQIAAFEWLALIDDEKYTESWEQAASLFGSRVSRDQWVDTIRSARAPFGKVRRNVHIDAKPSTDHPTHKTQNTSFVDPAEQKSDDNNRKQRRRECVKKIIPQENQ